LQLNLKNSKNSVRNARNQQCAGRTKKVVLEGGMTAAPGNPQEGVASATSGHVPGGAAAASAGEQAFRARRVPVRFAVTGVRCAMRAARCPCEARPR